MTDTLLPLPKYIIESGGYTALPSVISSEPEFVKAGKAFAAYIKEDFGANMVKGTDGIRLCNNVHLPEEGYHLTTSQKGVEIFASTSRGINRGLSTLFQMIKKEDGSLKIPCVCITDAPDSPYRGQMIDLAREWHEPDYLFRYVDLCWRNRASHLQLHFTDDQQFTLPIESFPRIGTQRYTKEEIAKLVEYAEDRGIILVPEVDIPGHTTQWVKAYPKLFGTTKVLAASDEVFVALRQIFAEVHAMFPHSPWIHIGGDEAETGEWEKCPITQAYMKKKGIETVGELYAEYVRTAAEIVFELGCTPVVWEGFAKEFNDRIPKETIVIAWESLYQVPGDLAAAGFTMINCSWEPLYICTNDKYWPPEDIMKWNPWTWRNWWERSHAYPDGITISPEKSNVIGGQICVWGNWLNKYGDLEAAIRKEYELTAERLPSLCERTWNV